MKTFINNKNISKLNNLQEIVNNDNYGGTN
jgi:hypothetical protein